MRFTIACRNGESLETVGDPVALPNTGDELFVVHFNPFFKNDFIEAYGGAAPLYESELFRVSHVLSGARVAGGDTIDEAIEHAIAKLIDKGEEGFQRALRRVNEERGHSAG
ncbi:hypothetical protein [Caballeronia sp. GAFFF2]|uniref:hypothetical protein n=1 Tax=Caballeronia sp. GAFFF2 TaxID=2921741 RepID=UPI0020287D49|nr:hypothetical protein [Caballeronia sp. GAFFF2]